jgi:hypothetical protein
MGLHGKLAELMVTVAPKIYTKYIIMKAALLYYQRFVTDLQSIGFEINPCDPCLAKKTSKESNSLLYGTSTT